MSDRPQDLTGARKPDRQSIRAAKLRDNLRRRKEQTRQRSATASDAPDQGDDQQRGSPPSAPGES